MRSNTKIVISFFLRAKSPPALGCALYGAAAPEGLGACEGVLEFFEFQPVWGKILQLSG